MHRIASWFAIVHDQLHDFVYALPLWELYALVALILVVYLALFALYDRAVRK